MGQLEVAGALLLGGERSDDERGSFARIWSKEDLAANGLVTEIAQCSVSHNALKGTLRGLHLQVEPHEEVKIVSCLRGALFDVVADLRRGSPTFGRWAGVQLHERSTQSLYVPAGCAHGFLTLEDDTLVHYIISRPHHPASARGVAWNDPQLSVRWPFPPIVISAKDRSNPPLSAFG